MHPSSIGLATALLLTFVTPGLANHGFAPRQPHIIPSNHAMMANHFWQAGRFGAREPGHFHRGRDGRQSVFFGSGYFGGSALAPADEAPALAFGGGAPVINVTVFTPTPGAASAPSPDYAASSRPKIILIGARPRSTRFEKLPVVIYGGT